MTIVEPQTKLIKQNIYLDFSPASIDDFTFGLNNFSFVQNPLNDLALSSSVVVYYGKSCCSSKYCTPCKCSGDQSIYRTYNTMIINPNDKKYLFKNVVKLNCFSCSLNTMSRFNISKSFSSTSLDQYYLSDSGVETLEMTKESGCTFCGVCSLFLQVKAKLGDQLFGYIRFKGCYDSLCERCCKCTSCCPCTCCDYIYCCDVLGANRLPLYTIFEKKLCCIGRCFNYCSTANYDIKNTNMDTVGKIIGKKICCNVCGICGSNTVYNIIFPPEATLEIKATIVNAVIAIDIANDN